MGFALTLAILAGLVVWLIFRPHPLKPWNTTAITADEPPAFDVVQDGKKIGLDYALTNTTSSDYRPDDSSLTVMAKSNAGTLISLSEGQASVVLPVFVPAKQRAVLTLKIGIGDIPQQWINESKEIFHERIRDALHNVHGVAGFVIFDKTDRYEILLPRWLDNRPTTPKP